MAGSVCLTNHLVVKSALQRLAHHQNTPILSSSSRTRSNNEEVRLKKARLKAIDQATKDGDTRALREINDKNVRN